MAERQVKGAIIAMMFSSARDPLEDRDERMANTDATITQTVAQLQNKGQNDEIWPGPADRDLVLQRQCSRQHLSQAGL